MKSEQYYKVNVFTNNEWVNYSTHKNETYARSTAEVINKSRGVPVRVVLEGTIVYAAGGSAGTAK